MRDGDLIQVIWGHIVTKCPIAEANRPMWLLRECTILKDRS